MFSSLSAVAAPSPKSGATCSNSGQTQTHKGLKYTCVKSGKKLVWNKGVTVKTAAPTFSKNPATSIVPKPISNSSESSSPAASPVTPTSPTATPKPTIARDATALFAFTTLRNVQTKNQLLELKYEYGSALDKDIKNYVTKLSESAAIRYSLFLKNPMQIVVHMFTERDLDKYSDNSAFQGEELKFFTDWWRKDSSIVNSSYGQPGGYYQNICKISKPTECTGATGQAGAAFPSRANLKALDYLNRGVVPHEMFHVIQDLIMYGNQGSFYLSQEDKDVVMPPTFREGGAVFIAFASGYEEFEDYEKAISAVKTWSYSDFPKELNAIQSRDDVVKLLVRLEKLDRSSRPEYLVGAALHEWLISTYGLDKYIELIQQHNYKLKFADVFKSVYGLSLVDAYRQAADHIYTRIKQ